MSVNGKPNEGDVYLDKDGYLRIYFKNIHSVWYDVLIAPEHKDNVMWLAEPKAQVYMHDDNKFVMNVKELLTTIRKELKDESSS
ncbi:hypothetical protein UFOVP337_36 [uncultured Caudovirales phage]|uniref:Uncharacterized protein n=1 Tax=uncultured Caudovirales phage TaxID=2100421 RepID=A0A6J5M2S3_9CAUD|nr:hypothetical protein UFOVP337_36 [uncultured Caudovirales phage]